MKGITQLLIRKIELSHIPDRQIQGTWWREKNNSGWAYMPALLSSTWQARNLTTTLLLINDNMKYNNKYKSQNLNSNQCFMSKSVLKLKKKTITIDQASLNPTYKSAVC